MTISYIRLTVELRGILQGVGFRPAMARIVKQAGLTGWVRNQSGTVRLVLDGPCEAVEEFIGSIAGKLPPRARLEEISTVSKLVIEKHEAAPVFEILRSSSTGSTRVSIPADLAMCEDCRSDVFNRSSRYYRYPFTTCTNCGPRYTVVEAMPYDRERTALKEFPLCSECRAEYTDASNRRYHAESIACPVCGPQLFWADGEGNIRQVEDPLLEARRKLAQGSIVAVRGLGGYLLVTDAANRVAIERLRQRKKRPAKPFAVMARNLEVLRKHCMVSMAERELLSSPSAPIVVLDTLKSSTLPLDILAPKLRNLGVMLPTTPLHALLAEQLDEDPVESFDFLVMTSGNRGGEPVCISNAEAFDRLSGIADFFLGHNRTINLRNDDSLAVVDRGEVQLWRRARGYAPDSIVTGRSSGGTVLAMGAELKNTVCLAFDGQAVLSPHIGNLETPEALDGLEQVVNSFPGYFSRIPEVIAVDLHPDMHSTRVGRTLGKKLGIPVVEVQHHHAHALSVMCEHGIEEAIAVVFDGTGLGTDGAIWGGELLHVYPGGWKRLGTLSPSLLLGGDTAVKRPAKQLAARFWQLGLTVDRRWRSRLGVSEYELSLWRAQFEKKLNSFDTHAAGRVFDAFSAGLSISPSEVSYEGQAAIWLESAAAADSTQRHPDFDIEIKIVDGLSVVDLSAVFAALHGAFPPADQAGSWAMAFHRTMAKAAVAMVDNAGSESDTLPVVLSGGVMMNRLFVSILVERLRRNGKTVFTHRLVPPNDGGISLGQVCAIQGDY